MSHKLRRKTQNIPIYATRRYVYSLSGPLRMAQSRTSPNRSVRSHSLNWPLQLIPLDRYQAVALCSSSPIRQLQTRKPRKTFFILLQQSKDCGSVHGARRAERGPQAPGRVRGVGLHLYSVWLEKEDHILVFEDVKSAQVRRMCHLQVAGRMEDLGPLLQIQAPKAHGHGGRVPNGGSRGIATAVDQVPGFLQHQGPASARGAVYRYVLNRLLHRAGPRTQLSARLPLGQLEEAKLVGEPHTTACTAGELRFPCALYCLIGD